MPPAARVLVVAAALADDLIRQHAIAGEREPCFSGWTGQ
jgi:hypothetical protein